MTRRGSGPDLTEPAHRRHGVGVMLGASAYLLWGLLPIYWKLLQSVPAFEIVMHRIVWSFLLLVALVTWRGSGQQLWAALTTRRTLLILLVTTFLVAANWLLFIWAVNTNRVLHTSLGYFINPLVNVLLGMVFLRERLRPQQMVAVLLAAAAVVYLTFAHGALPWISLALPLTFGSYGLIRKVAPVSALVGLTVETLLLSIPAGITLVWLFLQGHGAFGHVGLRMDLLLMAAALATAIPLLLFTLGARRVPFTTIGFLQYIAPTCTFFLGAFLWHEPLGHSQLLAFIGIWIALAVYTHDIVRHHRRSRGEPEGEPL